MDGYLPQPFLDREEANKRMKALGFKFGEEVVVWEDRPPVELLLPGQEAQLQALMDLIAAAIAEWSDARPEGGGFEELNEELQTYAQEWLVG